MLQRQAQRTIADHCLLQSGQCVLVGVSGGADSVAMLHVLSELSASMDLDLKIAHLNHGIRGKDASRDAEFVTRLAESLGLTVIQKKVDVRGLARRKGISLEMAGREARYAFFSAAARKVGADAVATAHTADDQAETVLLKLARGAGAGGLGGIRYRATVAGLVIVRPLLDVTRVQVVSYLRGRSIEWCEDESNRDTAFLRNRVRCEVLPFMETKLNPGLRRALLRSSDLLREEDAWLDSLSRAILSECATAKEDGELQASALGKHPLAARRRVLRLWLSANGVGDESLDLASVDRVERLLGGRSGGVVTLASGWRVRGRYGRLIVSQGELEDAKPYKVALAVPGETLLPELGLRIAVLVAEGVEKAPAGRAGVLPASGSVSLKQVRRRRVYVRSWRRGDRMRPLGMRGSKKIQDIFVDEKVPREQRHIIPLFECAGEVIWLPGYRVARDWAVDSEKTSALQFRVHRI